MKFNIATTLFVLISMAVVCCVVIMHAFIQRDFLRLEVEKTVGYLESTVSGSLKPALDITGVADHDLSAVCESAKSRCVAAVLFREGDLYSFSADEGRYGDLDALVKSAATSQLVTVEAGDSKRLIFVAVPLMHKPVDGFKKSAIGMAIKKPFVAALLMKNYEPILVYLFVTVLLLSVVGFFRLAKLFVKPIERIIRLSEHYQDPEELPHFNLHSGDEFGKLSAALNSLIMRIEVDREKLRQAVKTLEETNTELQNTQAEMVRTEKLASIGRLSAGLAHEIGNPIGIVQGYVELLKQDDLDDVERREFAQRAYGELERIHNLVLRLLNFSRNASQNIEAIDLGPILKNVVEVLKAQADKFHIKMFLDLDGQLMVNGDEESLKQVFFNCVMNSIDAINDKNDGDKGLIHISAHLSDDNDDGQSEILIQIHDNGRGIDQINIENLFDPFFTTKGVGVGTGLGLFVAHTVMESHGGRIWLEGEENTGATVFIAIPVNTSR